MKLKDLLPEQSTGKFVFMKDASTSILSIHGTGNTLDDILSKLKRFKVDASDITPKEIKDINLILSKQGTVYLAIDPYGEEMSRGKQRDLMWATSLRKLQDDYEQSAMSV